ncbi:hypothetical protein [Roseibium sp. MMSF_3412]|uniref:hypothetical protein n=1 Tax=Roseibium sp. MMSF_3412 TaxID=3046712 RepID=UPI00273ED1DF|nr:hypothetical protein [Roseibium sp. MMSF_3412]
MSHRPPLPGLPPVWNARRGLVCAWLVLTGFAQTTGAIILSAGSAALLTGQPHIHSFPVLPVLCLSGIVTLGAFVLLNRGAERFALSYVHDVRLAYARHVLLFPFDGKSPSTGLSLTRLVNDLGAVKLWLSRGLLALVTLSATLITLAAWIGMASPAYVIPMSVCLLVWALGTGLALPGLRKSIRESRQKRGAIAVLLGKTLPERLPLLLHGKLAPVLNRLSRRSEEVCSLLVGRATWSATMKAASRATFPAAVAAYALSGSVEPGAIAQFLLIFAFLAAQLEAGAAGLEYYEANRVAREKLSRVFSTDPLAPLGSGTNTQPDWSQAIEISDLRLPSGKLLSTRIAPGACEWLSLDEPQDLQYLALCLCGLTLREAQRNIRLASHTFADIDRKALWRNVTLVSPSNGIPVYRQAAPAVLFGSRTKAGTEQKETLGKLPGLVPDRTAAAARISTDREQIRIRLARALLRRPRLLVVRDDGLLGERDLLEYLKEQAGQRGTTLVLLAQRQRIASS